MAAAVVLADAAALAAVVVDSDFVVAWAHHWRYHHLSVLPVVVVLALGHLPASDDFDYPDAVVAALADFAASADHPAAVALADCRLVVAVCLAASVGFAVVRQLVAAVSAVEGLALSAADHLAVASVGFDCHRLAVAFVFVAAVVSAGLAATAVAFLVCRKLAVAACYHHPIFSFCWIFPVLSG